MIKKLFIVYLLIGFIGYTFFEEKDLKINYIVSINGEVSHEVKEILTSETIKSNMLICAYSYDDIIGIKHQEIKQVGSGVIIDEKDNFYYVLTNAHVISFRHELSKLSLKVYDYQGNCYKGIVVKVSREQDLALVKFKKASDLKVVSLSDEVLYEGDTIYAIGNPYEVLNSITVGKVNNYTNINYTDYKVVSHSAEINSGNSGGMLLNEKFELVGINTWAYYDKTGKYASSLAIPTTIIIKFLY